MILENTRHRRSDSLLSSVRQHFVERHREALMRITQVDSVIRDLRYQNILENNKFFYILNIPKDVDKMRRLYNVAEYWTDIEKDYLYIALRKYNYSVIRELEKMDQIFRSHMKTGEHFIDRYPENLINKITSVDPVVNDLWYNDLLSTEQYEGLVGSVPEKMRRLYDIARHWDDTDKDQLYNALWRYNTEAITDLTIHYQYDLSPNGHHVHCRSCRKNLDPSSEITPIVTGTVYRLEFKTSGLFRCSRTGIKFLVRRPVTIDYELDSWGHYSDCNRALRSGFQFLSPLFNIRAQTLCGAVLAVYLPHFLCLQGFNESTSWIKCAHYKDDNLVLETPTRIEPYYVVLENPTFSALGVLLYPLTLLADEIMRRIPCHGMVLIYWRTLPIAGSVCMECKIHLYLTSSSPSVQTVIDSCEKQYEYCRIHKPPQTESLYIKTRYAVSGPQSARVKPKTLLFQASNISEVYPFIEIRINLNNEEEDIGDVSVLPEDTDIPVWETELTRGDMTLLTSAMSQPSLQEGSSSTQKHFVDRHRKSLIERVGHIEPVLDELLGQELLTQEQYDIIREKEPHQEKMRQLYQYVTSWGDTDKQKVYMALRGSNKALIRDLGGL